MEYNNNKIISIDAYNEFMNLRERFNIILVNREEQKKQSEKKYYQSTTKGKVKHCSCCNIHVKNNSFSNHQNSKKHINNLEQIINLV